MTMMIETLRNGLAALGLAPSTKSRQLATALVEESEAERLQTRRELASERAAVEAEQLVRVRAYEPRRAAALDAIARRRAEAEAAVVTLQAMEREELTARAELTRRHDRLSSALVETASPMIAACVRALRDEWTATCRLGDEVVTKRLDGKFRLAWSNRESIERRAAAILAAIETVKTLVCEALDDAALEARLEAIRAALPAVEPRPAKYDEVAS